MLYTFPIVIAVAMFFATNWIGKHSISSGYFQLGQFSQISGSYAFSAMYRIFAPIAFLCVIAIILYWTNHDAFVQTLPYALYLYFALRLVFNFATDRIELVNFPEFILTSVASVITYLALHELVVTKKDLFIPDPQDVGTALWLSLAAFIYKTINSIETSEVKARRRRVLYVTKQASKYTERYAKQIRQYAIDDDEYNLVMAVLIYEGFNRPAIVRRLEPILLLFKTRVTMGPMQVATTTPISDETSVSIGAERLLSSYREFLGSHEQSSSWQAINYALSEYNGHQYAAEVEDILALIPRKADN
ncbi:hypothetical protein [Pseudoxanthomonas sp. PXM02]|uniref:hypothetical protein n=1 Tax=Pseudoxanthomonas sp. PXM02 TaxID=2769294 RepID=UPI0017864873|nr:hypothetical protein [Pseudoxanthomonas sp. PXM02]MBD9479865.1 hypothetical protein [Pseudoxanthomonas sp. PXM02]